MHRDAFPLLPGFGDIHGFTFLMPSENETFTYKKFLGKITLFKLSHMFDDFGKGFEFSLIYLKSGTVFWKIVKKLNILSLSYFFIYLLYIVMNCYWLLVLDPTYVPARHYFQHKVRFVTY